MGAYFGPQQGLGDHLIGNLHHGAVVLCNRHGVVDCVRRRVLCCLDHVVGERRDLCYNLLLCRPQHVRLWQGLQGEVDLLLRLRARLLHRCLHRLHGDLLDLGGDRPHLLLDLLVGEIPPFEALDHVVHVLSDRPLRAGKVDLEGVLDHLRDDVKLLHCPRHARQLVVGGVALDDVADDGNLLHDVVYEADGPFLQHVSHLLRQLLNGAQHLALAALVEVLLHLPGRMLDVRAELPLAHPLVGAQALHTGGSSTQPNGHDVRAVHIQGRGGLADQ
mmetsp:Transcript_69910/g.158668  ORF Transcript_69910/g.158668 Transcript_69910/m.158668 type:complete len:275 (-) Transcript_69910:520-1344(-)